MLSKSLSKFSVDGWSCVPSLLLTWGQTMVEVMKIMATSFKRSHDALLHSLPPTLQQATTDPHPCWRLLDTPGQVWVSLLLGYYSFLLGPGVQGSVCAFQEPVSPVLCKFWRLYGGVHGDLLGLCHTQACCTQSPWPCGSPLLTHTSTGNTQKQFCLSLCGVSGS